jgi:hypothetical protein
LLKAPDHAVDLGVDAPDLAGALHELDEGQREVESPEGPLPVLRFRTWLDHRLILTLARPFATLLGD